MQEALLCTRLIVSRINQVKLTAHLAIIVARKFAETSGTCSVTEIGDFCGSHFCSRKINPSGAQRSLNRETANGCGKHLKEKMCGICGTLWILLQLEQQIQLAFRVLPHIDLPNENCNKTATSIPIDTVLVCVCPRSCVAINWIQISNTICLLLLYVEGILTFRTVISAQCTAPGEGVSDSRPPFTKSKHGFM